MGLTPCFLFKGGEIKKVGSYCDQSEERKSFNPPFLLPCLSSRMSILLRRPTQFFALDGVLEEEEADPGVLEEVDDLEGERERERECW